MLLNLPPRKEKVWIELCRQATVAERLWLTFRMTDWEIRRARQQIAEANPDLSPEEVKLRWVEMQYGKQLAQEVREYLSRA